MANSRNDEGGIIKPSQHGAITGGFQGETAILEMAEKATHDAVRQTYKPTDQGQLEFPEKTNNIL
jgi:hypothetical protein